MGVLERVKDWLGVLDDADDFVDRSVKIRSNLDRIVSLVVDGGRFLESRLSAGSLQKPSDFQFLDSFVRSTVGRKGEITKLLASDLTETERLMAKAKSLGIKEVVPVLSALRDDIRQALLQNRNLFEELDLVMKAWSRIRRGYNIRAVTRIIVGAAISFTSAAVVLQSMNRGVTGRLATLETAAGIARKATPTGE